MKIRCLIVDDEPIAQEIIESYLEHLEQFEVVAKCVNALEANNYLMQEQVDLIFLDIEMPHLNGLSFLRTLEHRPQVIVTTAYRDHALEGFELDVADYMLKPISQERFLKGINKIVARPKMISTEAQYIYLKVDTRMVKVVLSDIFYIEGLSNYVKIFTEGKTLISYQKLTHLEEILPTDQFIRSHRSYIVNLHKITAYTTTDIEIKNTELPIGGKYRSHLATVLGKRQY